MLFELGGVTVRQKGAVALIIIDGVRYCTAINDLMVLPLLIVDCNTIWPDFVLV